MKIRCPICKKEIEWSEENIFRPFCSQRCQTTDLGEWAQQKRGIPTDHTESEVEESDAPSENEE